MHYGGGAACGPCSRRRWRWRPAWPRPSWSTARFNERSGFRFGQGGLISHDPNSFETVHFGWYMPFGLSTPARVGRDVRPALHARLRRASRTTSAASRSPTRDYAATNPDACFYGKPITLEDHQQSRWIAEPLRLLDCCQESDGAVAIVVTSSSGRATCKQPPAVIAAAAQGAAGDYQMMTSYYRPT